MLENDIEILPKKRRLIINLTSLIDVLFLLIIFFTGTSTFIEKSSVKISLPKIKGEISYKKSNTIEIAISKNNKIFINNKAFSRKKYLSQIKQMMKSYPEKKKPNVSFKIDQNVKYGAAIEIISELRHLGIETIMALTKPEK